MTAFFAGFLTAGFFTTFFAAFLAGFFALRAFFTGFFAAFLVTAFFAGFAAFLAAFLAVFFAAMALCRSSSRSMFVFSSGVRLPAERIARTASSSRPPKALIKNSRVACPTICSRGCAGR